jgi:uncharacterized protein (UPF0276 family)
MRAPAPQAAAPVVPRLGVGIGYQPELRPFLESFGDDFDFLEVVPDVLWNDRGPGTSPRYLPDPEGTVFVNAMAGQRPVVPHSIGLSIGSAHRFEREHLAQMAHWYDWLGFPWHSDHLAFHLAEPGEEWNVNLTLPVPLDRETLEMIAGRVLEVQRRVPVPFLLENNVYYFDLPEQELDEPTFLNTLCRQSGCGLLLDLHNHYVNCRNRGADALRSLAAYDLERVVELHVAGGLEFRGVYLDAHSGPTPEPVWELLDWVAPRCPNLGGVVFELFGSWFEPMGAEALRRQLGRMRETWWRHHPAPETALPRLTPS